MSKKTSKKITVLAAMMMMVCGIANAASKSFSRGSDYSSYSSGSSSKVLHADLQMHFLRGTKPTDGTDTATRLSVGGMFSSWVGLDLFGMMGMKSKNTLIGANLALMPTEWFFMKGGVGAFTDKQTKELKSAPVFGTGVKANVADGVYFISEFTYFELPQQKNLTFGAGLGMAL